MEQDENRKSSWEGEPFIGLPIVDLRKATLKPGIVDEELKRQVIDSMKEYQRQHRERMKQNESGD